MPRHHKQTVSRGLPLGEARQVMILVHGRGASATNILTLADHLAVKDFHLIAPQAQEHTWYPFSFMAPVSQNEPGLSSGLEVLGEILTDMEAAGYQKHQIHWLGFSQGACLTSEFVARNGNRYGGVYLYSGGVIGDRIDHINYRGDLAGTPIFMGCSDVDPHIPLTRVDETARIFEDMGAKVDKRLYPNAPHTILPDEIEAVNQLLAASVSQ